MNLLLIAGLLLASDLQRAGKDMPELRVATFNIRYGTANDGENRWEKRKELVFRTIHKMNPDVIGLQEVLAFQLEELHAALPEYEFVGVGRNDGKRDGEFVPVFYKSNRFEKLAEGHFWLSDTPETPGSRGWDAAVQRVVTWVRLRDRNTKRVVLFMNTHFDHKGVVARNESAKLLRARMEQLREGVPAIVVGDFNTTEDKEPYRTMLGKETDESRLLDSYRVANPKIEPEETTFHAFKGGRAGWRIDWILHSADVKTLSCEIVHESDGQRYPSDHYPVAAVLSVAPI